MTDDAGFDVNSMKITSASVILIDLPFRPGSLVAFVTAASESKDLVPSLTSTCEEKLHQYLQPTFIHFLSETEYQNILSAKTVNLHVLALKLFLDKGMVKPRNDTETQIEEIWRAQLESSTVISVTSSFFALGGDSLKAGKLVAAMRKKLGVQLSVADLLSAPTIGE